MKNYLLIFFFILIAGGCNSKGDHQSATDVENKLDHSKSKLIEAVKQLDINDGFPRSIKHGNYTWSSTGIGGWTSGFFPGLLWHAYEYSGDENLLEAAMQYSEKLKPLKELDWNTHDLGFMMYNSVGLGYRITGNPEYKEWLLQTADSLAALYNPAVGTILSWPWMKRKNNWPHNTIIDNMLNLELLFWSAKNGGNPDHYNMAVSHALTTLKNHFREDYSSYHVLVYDSASPLVLQKITDQGYADESVWARGQAWALYGYVLCYRETGMQEFKDAAIQIADFYINHLPDDFIPYWDFKLPDFKNQEKDASAAAIAASGLLELSELLENKKLKEKYLDVAVNTINSLSSDDYLSHDTMAILNHSVGSKPHDSEVDVPLIYADYYYVEALMRLWKIRNNRKII